MLVLAHESVDATAVPRLTTLLSGHLPVELACERKRQATDNCVFTALNIRNTSELSRMSTPVLVPILRHNVGQLPDHFRQVFGNCLPYLHRCHLLLAGSNRKTDEVVEHISGIFLLSGAYIMLSGAYGVQPQAEPQEGRDLKITACGVNSWTQALSHSH